MRWIRHLFAPSARRLFPEVALQRITAVIDESEQHHSGEICFAVEPALPLRAVMAGVQARERAEEVFAQLRVWDTRANNGVLIYLLLADHRIEVVADRGFDGRVEPAQWQGVCRLIEDALRAGKAETGVVRGIHAASQLLVAHFPRNPADEDENEVPNRPHLL